MSAGAALDGARVQRVDGPRRDLFVLTLHRADLHGCLVLSTASGRAGVAWAPERPRGDPASSFVRLLRKHLEGGRVTAASADPKGASITIRRAEVDVVLRLALDPPNLLLFSEGRRIASLRPSVESSFGGEPANALVPETLEPALTRLIRGGDERARALERALARREKQLERRLRAIAGDLGRVDEVAPLRARASLLLAHLHAIPAGATEAQVTDWNADPPAPIRIAIDPALGARGQAEALFRRARKLERGAEIALARHEETAREIAECEALRRAAEDAAPAEIERLERAAARLGVHRQQPGARAQAAARKPHRTFRGAGDRPIWVGRSAADNDTLTVRLARPHDHWLHARGVTGSHVIIPLERSETCPPELLVDAGHLAAHFSEARGEASAEVQHVARRHVRKPRGSAPGAVVVTREKVLLLRIEPERLRRLLGSEER